MPKNIASENIKIPKQYNAMERRAIARDVIEYIRGRTQQGRGEGGKSWPGKAGSYSESYKKSLDFKLKKNKGVVNLTLSSDMLTAVEMLKNNKGEISVGVPFSAPEWGRAKGNILGTYGKNSPIPGKQRPFLKLSPKEIQKIISKYPLDDKKRSENLEDLKKQDQILRGS